MSNAASDVDSATGGLFTNGILRSIAESSMPGATFLADAYGFSVNVRLNAV
jgi:hypothetical protein